MSFAVACASGGFRVIFIHGVLSALETSGLRASIYAGTSASVVPASLAAIGSVNEMGMAPPTGLVTARGEGKGMSTVVLEGLAAFGPLVNQRLFTPGMPRFCIPVSAVTTPKAAEQTQGKQARRLGRRLLLDAARNDGSWAQANLRLELFDSAAVDPAFRLTPENFEAVAYASSRMLHAWDIPAWIADRPYIDASYTCSCPAIELAEMGCDAVIAITAETGPLYRHLFGSEVIPDYWNNTPIHIIRPDFDLKELGIDYTQAAPEGVAAVYGHGQEKGREFVSRL